jgi:Fur family ferric uptake transcriptional regulator
LSRKPFKFQTEKAIFQDYIKDAGLRRTGQRDLILDTFLSTEEHLTSEDLCSLVHKVDRSIGLTTVYRTLKLLTEAGLAREVRFGDNRTYN